MTIVILLIVLAGLFASYATPDSQSAESEVQTSATSEKSYSFLDYLGSAEITSDKGNLVKVTKSVFTINGDKRVVLFEHPDTQITFKDILIHKNAELRFGIGMQEASWDKAGDGVLFEIVVFNKKLQNNMIFSRYINPKNNIKDRKWFDNNFDLNLFAGQRVSFVFKTTGGPKGNIFFDWAGWSSPQITVRAANS